MNMKRIIPGILAAAVLFTASVAHAGGNHHQGWAFSINIHDGQPSYHIVIGQNRPRVQHRQWRKKARQHRRHHRMHRNHHNRRHHANHRGHRRHWQ